MNAKKWVFEFLDTLQKGDRITGYAMMRLLLDQTGIMRYPATVLRHLRAWRQHTGTDIICISKPRSLYEVQ